MVTVSIVTPVRNGEKTLSRTIESVLHQQYKPTEYIVINGDSTDASLEIARQYEGAFKEAGINYRIISEKDEGVYDALNHGISVASGELIGNINSDDWYEENAVKTMVNLYARNPYDIAWSDIYIRNNGRIIRKKARIGKIWTTNHFCHPSMFARRQVLLDNPYNKKILDADYDLILRANNNGLRIVTENVPISNYSTGGISTRKSFKNMMHRINMKYDTYRRNGYSHMYWFYCVIIEAVKFALV
ncbi:glycosyltransferase [Butyrivibrio sp. MC2021]|uniref:glycosyltransferase n=1 Tax=Butyrivibrio sp. MC2021 TaxID=1408306 RepID=UPI00056428A4|nr:glycosyltransferase [Butyrivibrio sp. MC2021]